MSTLQGGMKEGNQRHSTVPPSGQHRWLHLGYLGSIISHKIAGFSLISSIHHLYSRRLLVQQAIAVSLIKACVLPLQSLTKMATQ